MTNKNPNAGNNRNQRYRSTLRRGSPIMVPSPQYTSSEDDTSDDNNEAHFESSSRSDNDDNEQALSQSSGSRRAFRKPSSTPPQQSPHSGSTTISSSPAIGPQTSTKSITSAALHPTDILPDRPMHSGKTYWSEISIKSKEKSSSGAATEVQVSDDSDTNGEFDNENEQNDDTPRSKTSSRYDADWEILPGKTVPRKTTLPMRLMFAGKTYTGSGPPVESDLSNTGQVRSGKKPLTAEDIARHQAQLKALLSSTDDEGGSEDENDSDDEGGSEDENDSDEEYQPTTSRQQKKPTSTFSSGSPFKRKSKTSQSSHKKQRTYTPDKNGHSDSCKKKSTLGHGPQAKNGSGGTALGNAIEIADSEDDERHNHHSKHSHRRKDRSRRKPYEYHYHTVHSRATSSTSTIHKNNNMTQMAKKPRNRAEEKINWTMRDDRVLIHALVKHVRRQGVNVNYPLCKPTHVPDLDQPGKIRNARYMPTDEFFQLVKARDQIVAMQGIVQNLDRSDEPETGEGARGLRYKPTEERRGDDDTWRLYFQPISHAHYEWVQPDGKCSKDLQDAIKTMDWKTLGPYLQKRTTINIKVRWEETLSPTLRKGPWDDVETMLLMDVAKAHYDRLNPASEKLANEPLPHNISGIEASDTLQTRSQRQCTSRWKCVVLDAKKFGSSHEVTSHRGSRIGANGQVEGRFLEKWKLWNTFCRAAYWNETFDHRSIVLGHGHGNLTGLVDNSGGNSVNRGRQNGQEQHQRNQKNRTFERVDEVIKSRSESDSDEDGDSKSESNSDSDSDSTSGSDSGSDSTSGSDSDSNGVSGSSSRGWKK